MPKRHYTIYCDESATKGAFFSNFYGGAIVKSSELEAINTFLNARKDELNLFNELKWTRITENYQQKYIDFIDSYFDLVATGRIRMRIMFTHNQYRPKNLTKEHVDNQYFILYYQLIKHAFGLAYCNPKNLDRVYVGLLLDEIPHNINKFNSFKDYMVTLSNTQLFRDAQVVVQREQIADVNSKDHVILQGLDIILGAMQFRLNDKHKEKPTGAKRRGKRTIAKERVYNHIRRRINAIYKNFNIGISTGTPNGLSDRWLHCYRHWKFTPKEFEYDDRYVKNK
jgi:hypothetical protein